MSNSRIRRLSLAGEAVADSPGLARPGERRVRKFALEWFSTCRERLLAGRANFKIPERLVQDGAFPEREKNNLI